MSFPFNSKMKFIHEYCDPKYCGTLEQLRNLFELAGIILGRDSELYDMFVMKFWKKFYR